MFLNEHCKDALNIGDFINSLQITLDDLSVTREKTLEDSVENIFLRGLKELDIYKRPIHCTDHKRDVMYIKDEEKWEKDEGNIKLKGTIGAISRKQIKKLKECSILFFIKKLLTSCSNLFIPFLLFFIIFSIISGV